MYVWHIPRQLNKLDNEFDINIGSHLLWTYINTYKHNQRQQFSIYHVKYKQIIQNCYLEANQLELNVLLSMLYNEQLSIPLSTTFQSIELSFETPKILWYFNFD